MVALGSDHAGYPLKEHIRKYLIEKGIQIVDMGCFSTDSVHYPEYGEKVARAVASGRADLGVIVCGTGIGISIAANKVSGIRAALCTDSYMARMARVVGAGVAEDIVDAFLYTSFEGGRHSERVDMIMRIKGTSD